MQHKSLMTESLWGFLEKALRFGVVGAFGSAFNYVIFLTAFQLFNVQYLISGAAGFVLAIPPVYFVNKHWTFKSKARDKKGLPSYILVCLFGLCVHLTTQWSVVNFFGIAESWSQLVGITGSAISNFILAKWLVFNDER